MFIEEEINDSLNLIRRATMKGTQSERVGKIGRKIKIAELTKSIRDLLTVMLHHRRGILHSADVILYAFGLDSLEVITDAHVINHLPESRSHFQLS